MIKNYDLNIYDRLAYETSGEETGGWVVVAYTIPQEGAQYGTGRMFEKHLRLSDSNVRYMRLEEEDEVWIDSDSLRDEGRMPRRVARWLEGLDAKA